MTFTATDEQIQKMCALAVQASSPMGMGLLHYQPETQFKPEDFPLDERGAYLDYVQGRMVKLRMRRLASMMWEAPDSISSAYESWVHTYPSYEALAKAAGVTIE